MNKLAFSANSWHYWFVNKTTDYLEYGNPDICGYTRAFIAGVIKTLLASTVLSFILTTFICAITLGLSLLFKWQLFGWVIGLGKIGAMLSGIVTGFIIIGLIVTTIRYLKDRAAERREGKPSALKEMYTSWKQKTCTQIEFK